MNHDDRIRMLGAKNALPTPVRTRRPYVNHASTRAARAAKARDMGGIRKFIVVMSVLFPR